MKIFMSGSTVTLAMITALAISACDSSQNLPDSTRVSSVVNLSRIFPSSTIPLCFIHDGDVSNETRELLRSYLINQYRRSNIRFSVLDACGSLDLATRMIRLKMYSTGVNSTPDGHWSHPGGYSMVGAIEKIQDEPLATTRFGTPKLWSNSLPKGLINYTLYTAVHEVGHGISLKHEQGRNDDPRADSCRKEFGLTEVFQNGVESGQGILQFVGPYDPNSIMNYCAETTVLSNGDITGINSIYPKLSMPGLEWISAATMPENAVLQARTTSAGEEKSGICRAGNGLNKNLGSFYLSNGKWHCSAADSEQNSASAAFEILVRVANPQLAWKESSGRFPSDTVPGGWSETAEDNSCGICQIKDLKRSAIGNLCRKNNRITCTVTTGNSSIEYPHFDALISQNLQWSASRDGFSLDIVRGGLRNSTTDNVCGVCRVHQDNKIYLGEFCSSQEDNVCQFVADKQVQISSAFEVLKTSNPASLSWVSSQNDLPTNAHPESGEFGVSYICRASLGLDLLLGSLRRDGNLWRCYTAVDGKMRTFDRYELLTLD